MPGSTSAYITPKSSSFDDASDAVSCTSISSNESEDTEPYYVSNGKICSDDLPQSNVNIEQLAERLFSIDHLKLILEQRPFFIRFRAFLLAFQPHLAVTLRQYLDVQKALAAVCYANALAENLWPGLEAAMVKEDFEARSKTALDKLLNEALPMYITHKATELVTDVLAKEITGHGVPSMKHMLHGLAEVYCLSDPHQQDNPIVYASEEFYRTTLYAPEHVIGKNCRFLQGSVTSSASVLRIIEALSEGKELCETILNYRRDGSPFLNLLVIAPLYDSSGKVRFFLGAQVDVNGLFEDGRGLESLARLLQQDKTGAQSETIHSSKPLDAFAGLGRLLNDKERSVIHASHTNGASPQSHAMLARETSNGADSDEDICCSAAQLSLSTSGPNGRLVGVFQNYLLVSPAPALRIVFASPLLNSPTLINAPLLSRIRGPQKLRQSIDDALNHGACFTAKVSWLTDVSVASPGPPAPEAHGAQPPFPLRRSVSRQHSDMDASQYSRGNLRNRLTGQHDKLVWIHCTPLLDRKNRVGVWMVVMVKCEAGLANEGLGGDISFNRR